MHKKNVAALSLMLTIALSMFGYAYATWSDKVLITGSAKMGTLQLVFYYVEHPRCTEYWLNPDTGQLVEGEFLDKDVGKCWITLPDPVVNEHTGKKGYKSFTVNIKDAYPSYRVHTTYLLDDIGTVPVVAYKYVFTGASYDKAGNREHDLYWDGKISGGKIFEDVDDDGLDPDDPEVINIDLTDKFPVQIDPDVTPDKREIDLHFKQPARQCHTYKITVEILGIQWNKLYEVAP